MKKLILWLWQLPQNILGVATIFFLQSYKWDFESDSDIFLHYEKKLGSVSLGDFIILNGYCYTENTVKHERGHQKQSKILGWLYLPLIGLPSVIGNLIHRLIKFDYYSQPWEAWADKLGGVRRH